MIAEQQRPGSFRAMYLFEPMVAGPASTAGDKSVPACKETAWASSDAHADNPQGTPCAGAPMSLWTRP